MTGSRTIGSWIWKILIGGIAHAAGTMLGAAAVRGLGLELPRVIGEVDPTVQLLLLLLGSMTIALGLAAMAAGMTGRWWERWAVLAAFAFVVNGVGTAIEGQIFSTLGGFFGAALMSLPASLLGALVVALLIPPAGEESFARRVVSYLSCWRPATLASRLALGLLAFPFFYFLFGMMVAPIVTPHYARLEFLVIPPLATILQVLFLRSALFLLVSLPVIVGWRRSRIGLTGALGLGHFTAVGLAGLIQAQFFPQMLRWIHGIEILADSMFYAWALAWLLWSRRLESNDQVAADEALLAATPGTR